MRKSTRSMYLRRRETTSVIGFTCLALMACSCVGTVGPSEAENGVDTFQSMMNSEEGGRSTFSVTQRADSSDSLQLATTITVARISKCHRGDLDLIKVLADKLAKQSAKGGEPVLKIEPQDVIVTLEADDGQVLGVAPLDVQVVSDGANQAKLDSMKLFPMNMNLAIRHSLLERRQFGAGLFVCLDTNHNGACADETISPIGSLGSLESMLHKTRVIYYRAVDATVTGGNVTFSTSSKPDPTKGSYAAVASQVEKWLLNLDLQKYGLSTDGLTVALAMRTLTPACQVMSPRTNGCFVAGTHIGLTGGLATDVEYLERGMAVVSAGGKRGEVMRMVSGPEPHPVITVRTDQGQELTVTQSHPLMTLSGLKPASELAVGELLLTGAGDYVEVTSLARRYHQGLVFNFALAGGRTENHLVVAEGLVVGDLVLQERLAGSTTKTIRVDSVTSKPAAH